MFLYFDRLTRFKYPEDKYFRVFSDIILKNFIAPSINKKQLEKLSDKQIIEQAKSVWKYSLTVNFTNIQTDFSINSTLYMLEDTYFNLTPRSKNFLNSNFNFLPLIYELDKKYETLSKNLKRICDIFYNRQAYQPIKKIILVEGITEDILLPQFAKLKEHNFDKEGYYIVVSGGKNQMVKQYTNWKKLLKLPIFILLDKDGIDVFPLIEKQLEKKDEIFMLKSGEFEDLLCSKLIQKTLKKTYPEIIEKVSKKDFNQNLSAVRNLEQYFKKNGLGEFKKADFAQNVKENCTNISYLNSEVNEILEKIILL